MDMRRRALVWVMAIALGAFGCQEASAPKPRQVTPLDPATLGTVSGQVRLDGPVPEQSVLQLGAFADCAAQQQGPVYTGDVLVKNGTLQNALVYVKQGLGDRVFAVPDTPVAIDQKGCLFLPRVAAAQAGQPVRFLNSDPLLHNVHGVPKHSRGWNFSLAVKGTSRTVTVDKPENIIELRCDVHPWMKAYLGVFDHPYFAVTGVDGRFELNNLPAGDYVIEVWHERFGTQSAAVSVAAKDTKEIAFTFSATGSPAARNP